MKDLFSMEGKTVVLTGGSGYLGSALAMGLLDYGSAVAVADITEKSSGDENASERLHRIRCDLSDTGSIRAMLEEAHRLMGRTDVLVNCGVYGAGYGAGNQIEWMSDADWLRGLDGAVGTAFRCIREVIPYMEKAGGGAIVNFGSMYGIVSPDFRIYGDNPSRNPPNYGSGKAAVIQLTKYAAAQLADKNIRVNCVSPGPFPAPANQTDRDFLRQLEGKTMLGRVGRAEEIVGAVLLLSSGAGSFMTGSNIVVDGGWTAW